MRGADAHACPSAQALATNLLQGQPSEWALLRRHPCEDVFGVQARARARRAAHVRGRADVAMQPSCAPQLCGGFPDALARTAELLEAHVECDFVDINMVRHPLRCRVD
jgi:tRNA-dihydrouridine synthase 3